MDMTKEVRDPVRLSDWQSHRFFDKNEQWLSPEIRGRCSPSEKTCHEEEKLPLDLSHLFYISTVSVPCTPMLSHWQIAKQFRARQESTL